MTGTPIKTLLLITGLMAGLWICPAHAESLLASLPEEIARDSSTTGVSMLHFAGSESTIVEELQRLQRWSQNPSLEAIQVMLGALNSRYPLARRKASHCLLDYSRQLSPEDQKILAGVLTQLSPSRDPIVSRNLSRLTQTVR